MDNNSVSLTEDYNLFIEFRVREHFAESISHKSYLEKVFDKIGGRYFPNVTFNDVSNHDNSKLASFVEVVGYTERWVWRDSVNGLAWQKALDHHYKHNSHHPEFHIDQHGVKMGEKHVLFSSKGIYRA